LEVLRKMKIPLSDSRDNVLPVGVEKIRSMLLGLYCHGPHFGVSTATKEFPWTVRLMIGTFRRAFPWFPFTSIQVNSGFASRPHVDRRSRGPSALIALGEHSGGYLWVHEPESGTVPKVLSSEEGQVSTQYRVGEQYWGHEYDVNGHWLRFDGHRMHYTLPFEGERHSLVFFTSSKFLEAPVGVRNEMFEAGFDFSWDEVEVSGWEVACCSPSGTLRAGNEAVSATPGNWVHCLADSLAPTSLVAYEAFEPGDGAWENVRQALGQVSRCPPGPLAFGYEAARASQLVDGARGASLRVPEASVEERSGLLQLNAALRRAVGKSAWWSTLV
jgi:hypothetical protein